MVIIAINGFAHRLTDSGLVESAPIELFGLPDEPKETKKVRIDPEGFEMRDPESMELLSADVARLRDILEMLKIQHPEDYVIPKVPKTY